MPLRRSQRPPPRRPSPAGRLAVRALALLALAPGWLVALALLALALAMLLPSAAVARHSDILLAGLVLATALGIPFGELARLREHIGSVLALSIVPLAALTVVAWLVGRPFGGSVRDGLLAVGVSSSEVASVGLVALAGADATIALGALAGSLVCAVLLGPPLLIWLGDPLSATGGGAPGDGAGALVARFALVVLAPLAAGVALRSMRSVADRLRALDEQREGVAAVLVAALVYAALSGERGARGLPTATFASALVLACSAVLGLLWRLRAKGAAALPGAFAIGMRDFAVAAALASQSFGVRAAVVPGVYGVLMLLAGSLAASRLRATAGRACDRCATPGRRDA
jgi:hypothetical protein